MKLILSFLIILLPHFIHAQSDTQVNIPKYGFSEKISAGPFTVIVDGRSADLKSGTLTGLVDLSFDVGFGDNTTLDLKMKATYSKNIWTFTKEATVSTDTKIPGITVSGQKLVIANGKWVLTADVNLKTLEAASGNLGLLPASGLLTIEEGQLKITYGENKPNPSVSIDKVMTASIGRTLTLIHEDNLWVPQIDASLTVMGTKISGVLSYQNSLLKFVMNDKDHPSAKLSGVGGVDFQSLTLTLGAVNSISGTALVKPTDPASQLLPSKGFTVKLSGTPAQLKLEAVNSKDIPNLSLGKLGGLVVWPIAVSRVTQDTGSAKYIWDIGTTFTILGKKITGKVEFEEDLIKIQDVILATGFPAFDLTLKKVEGGSGWVAGIKDKLTPQEVAMLCKKAGLAAAKNMSVNIDGFFTKDAFRLTMDKGLQMPSSVPSWLKMNSTTIKDISLTHSFKTKQSVADFKIDVDLSSIPGMGDAGVKTLSVVAGDGVAVNSYQGGTDQPWFIQAWTEMSSPVKADFKWYTPASTINTKGIAIGFSNNQNPIAVKGLPGASINTAAISFSDGKWEIGGGLNYTKTFKNPQLNSILGTKLDLLFTYDGTTFSATENLVVNGKAKVRDLIASAGLKLEMSKVNLTYSNNNWTLSVDSSLDWLSKKIGGSIAIPQNGPPSFTPSPVTGGWAVNFPGDIDPNFESIVITLGENYGCSGIAKLKVAEGSPLHNVFPAATTLTFSAHKGQGWSLKAENIDKSPIAVLTIGQDKLQLKDLSLARSVPQGAPDINGTASYVFGNGSKADCKFMVTPEETSFTIPEFSIIPGLALKAELKVEGGGSSKTYSGSLSGSLNDAKVKVLYGAFDLTPAENIKGLSIASGSFKAGDCSVSFTNLPPINGLTAGSGIEFGVMKSLSLSRTAGVNKLELDMYMGLGKLAPLSADKTGGVESIIKVEKSAVETRLDIILKSHIDLDVKFGTLSLTEIDINYLSTRKSKWSIDGKGKLHKLSSSVQGLMNTLELGREFDLDLGYEAGDFIVDVAFEKNKVLNLIPGRCSVDLSGLKLSAGESGFSMGCVSKIKAGAKTLPGLAVFDAKNASVDFKPEGEASFDLDWSIPNVGNFDVKGLTFSVGSDISLSSSSVKFTAEKPDALIWKALGSSTLSGSFFGTPHSLQVSMNLPGNKLKSRVKLNPLPDLIVELDKVTISTEGMFSGTGSAQIGDFSADITLGASSHGPIFEFKPHAAKALTQRIKNAQNSLEFILSCSSAFRLQTNVAGIPTISFDKVEMKVDDPKHPGKPYMDVKTNNLVFYTPGFIFFDRFEGLIDVAGVDCHTAIEFPDPLSDKSTKAAGSALVDLLTGKKTFVQALKELKAPSLSFQDTYAQLPEKLFGKNAHVTMKDKTYDVSLLADMIDVPDIKKMGEALMKKMLEDIDGKHTANVLGVELKSNISYSKGFRCELDMADTFVNTVRIKTTLLGDFQRSSYTLFADGKSELKAAGAWETMTDAQITLSDKEFSIAGELIGAKGRVTIDKRGFSFVGSVPGKVISGKVVANSSKFEIDATLKLGGHKVGDGKFKIKNGKISITLKKHVKNSSMDLKVSGTLSFDLKKDKASLSATVNGTIFSTKNIGGVSAKFGVTKIKHVKLKLSGTSVEASLKDKSGKKHKFSYSLR
jgi:hypothetical protein